MDIFNVMENTASKEVLFFNEPSVSLKAIMAINNVTLGPSICSCRVFDYQDLDQAIGDAINEAAFNAYSAALMSHDVGGGSSDDDGFRELVEGIVPVRKDMMQSVKNAEIHSPMVRPVLTWIDAAW